MARPPSRERERPRISTNDLALYMVSSETTKTTIIRRSKYPQTPAIIRYRDVRASINSFLTDPLRDIKHIVAAEEMFTQRVADTSLSAFVREDAQASIEVLHALQRLSNQLSPFEFINAPRDQQPLIIEGVEVSVRADLLVHGQYRGDEQVGAAILRMTQDDAASNTARERRRNIGCYVATLAKLHVEQNLAGDRTPKDRLCMSIDVQHGEVFQNPQSSTRRASDLRSACRFIAALWPTIERA